MSLNPLNELRYRYRLALEHLNRSERLFSLEDWPGTVSSAQLAIENLAKSIIAMFEIPTWGHDPSSQLDRLVNRFSEDLRSLIEELALITHEIAPEHGRSSYGEPSKGVVPSEIYEKRHAQDALMKAKKAKEIVDKIMNAMKVRI